MNPAPKAAISESDGMSLLVGPLALAALLLSVIGIYGVMAYVVEQHAREVGIRRALGGSRRAVLGLIVGQGMRVAAAGVVVGLLAASLATRLIASLLFGIGAADARTFLEVGALLTLAALLACLIPAARAAAVAPRRCFEETESAGSEPDLRRRRPAPPRVRATPSRAGICHLFRNWSSIRSDRLSTARPPST